MIRFVASIILVSCTSLRAAPPSPTTPSTPAAPAPPSALQPPPAGVPVAQAQPPVSPVPPQPSAQTLLHDATEAMRLGQLDVAFRAMEKAYAATPPAQRRRPLVLNRAILDLTQKVYVMRAVRELYQYLRANPEPDEPAMNILGAALHITADTPRLKQGALWQSAYKEWERRNDKLNESRPGYRRWGPDWLNDEQHARLQADLEQSQRAIEEQDVRVLKLSRAYDELRAQHMRLVADAKAITEKHARYGIRGTSRQWRDGRGNIIYDTRELDDVNLQREMNLRESEAIQLVTIRETQAKLQTQAAAVMVDLELEKKRLAALKAEQQRLKPQWPETFEPVELSALEPPPIPPPDPKAVAALAEKARKKTTRTASPFGDSAPAATRPAAALPQAPAPQPRAQTQQPATQPRLDSPFGPREIDKQRRP